MTVTGLSTFTAAFREWNTMFTLIGGTACDVVLSTLDIPFRTTKDLDIVICVEEASAPFTQALTHFIQAGGYQHGEVASDTMQCYRFSKPTTPAYPAMLELFSRQPNGLILRTAQRIIPLNTTPASSNNSLSFSAILLDDVYYQWIRTGTIFIDHLPVVRAEHLIPLKARAWLDLTARIQNGEKIDHRNVKKHRNDCLRLFPSLDPEYHPDIPLEITHTMTAFIAAQQDQLPNASQLGLPALKPKHVLDSLAQRYGCTK